MAEYTAPAAVAPMVPLPVRVDGDEVRASLTGAAGDAGRGRAIVLKRPFCWPPPLVVSVIVAERGLVAARAGGAPRGD